MSLSASLPLFVRAKLLELLVFAVGSGLGFRALRVLHALDMVTLAALGQGVRLTAVASVAMGSCVDLQVS